MQGRTQIALFCKLRKPPLMPLLRSWVRTELLTLVLLTPGWPAQEMPEQAQSVFDPRKRNRTVAEDEAGLGGLVRIERWKRIDSDS